MDSNYSAIVSRVITRTHPNADNIRIGEVNGFQIIVSKDVVDGELGVFFPCEGQLSHDFCVANSLYPIKDENGKKIGGGFFEENRRIRAQAFRGEKSEGYWCRLGSLEALANHLNNKDLSSAIKNLKEGFTFTDLAGVNVCGKYYSPATQRLASSPNAQGKAERTIKNKFFKEHVKTSQFRYDVDNIPLGSLLIISEKLHGTSARYGYLPELAKWPKWQSWLIYNLARLTNLRLFNGLLTYLKKTRLVGFLARFKPVVSCTRTEYALLSGSRTVQLKEALAPPFRLAVAKRLQGKLLKGETVYGELVGWESNGKTIMPVHSTKDHPNKALASKKTITYAYGQSPGTSKFYTYRITMTNPDGVVLELSDTQMRKRASELGLDVVPVIGRCTYSGLKADLENFVKANVDGMSTLDSSHIKEGVVVRVESMNGSCFFLKEKSFDFKFAEGIISASDAYVDPEDVA